MRTPLQDSGENGIRRRHPEGQRRLEIQKIQVELMEDLASRKT